MKMFKRRIVMSNDSWKGGAAGGGAVYGLGFIGALIYFIGHATSFGMGVLGFLIMTMFVY